MVVLNVMGTRQLEFWDFETYTPCQSTIFSIPLFFTLFRCGLMSTTYCLKEVLFNEIIQLRYKQSFTFTTISEVSNSYKPIVDLRRGQSKLSKTHYSFDKFQAKQQCSRRITSYVRKSRSHRCRKRWVIFAH